VPASARAAALVDGAARLPTPARPGRCRERGQSARAAPCIRAKSGCLAATGGRRQSRMSWRPAQHAGGGACSAAPRAARAARLPKARDVVGVDLEVDGRALRVGLERLRRGPARLTRATAGAYQRRGPLPDPPAGAWSRTGRHARSQLTRRAATACRPPCTRCRQLRRRPFSTAAPCGARPACSRCMRRW